MATIKAMQVCEKRKEVFHINVPFSSEQPGWGQVLLTNISIFPSQWCFTVIFRAVTTGTALK